MASHQEDLVAQFTAITGANPSVAQNALQSADWNIDQAVSLYYASQDENASQEPFDDDEPEDPIAPAPAGSTDTYGAGSSSSNQARSGGAATSAARRPKAMTIRDLQGGGDEDDDDDDKPQDMFAGGEKSGLAVQNPGNGRENHFNNIMNQARQNHERPPAQDDDEVDSSRPNYFTGRAQTLGGDDAPSRVVEDPQAAGRQRLPRVTRTLHLWTDGVSIDDGPLLRFDDPANQHIMHEINQGRAPKALLDVQPGQEVDLNLEPHKGENYVEPKKKYQPFGGQGQRLGAPTPGVATTPTTASASTAAATTASPAPAAASPAPPQVSIDDSQPTLQLQIRLGDGSRLSSRFNTTHTIGDVYEFVDHASPASTQRPYALMTTFPSKELSDKSQVLGEMSDFKRGGVVVQKWK